MSMTSREHRRVMAKIMALEARSRAARLPDRLTELPREDWPDDPPTGARSRRVRAWVSKAYIVQEYEDGDAPRRLSISRTAVARDGRWVDGITWDEIQAIKAAVGYGDRSAIEIYPPDAHVVNVANVRHIWIVADPGWMWR